MGKFNIKYGVVAALTMATFVAPGVGAYSTITIPASESVSGVAETKYQYTADEISAIKAGSIVFGSSHTAVYNKAYDGKNLSSEDVYVKYTYKEKTYYAQVSAALDDSGIPFDYDFYKAEVENGKLSANATEVSDGKKAGYYGVVVTVDGAKIEAGMYTNSAYAINVTAQTVSGSTLTTTAAEKKTLVYGDVRTAAGGFTAKIGTVAVNEADVLVFTTAAARASFIDGTKTAGELETAKTKITADQTLKAGTYYTYYKLTTTDDIAYSGSAKGTTHEFTGTLTVAPFNFTDYYKVGVTKDPVAFNKDGATTDITFTEKDNVTIPGATTKPDNILNDEETNKDTADYKVVYTNNKKAGVATATITGLNNFTGSATVNFTVKAAEVADIKPLVATYTGSAVEIKTITAGINKYNSGFTVSYAGAHTNASDSGVEVTIKGDGTSIITPTEGIKKKLTINALDLSGATQMLSSDWAKLKDAGKAEGKFIIIGSYAYSTSAPTVKFFVDGNEVSTSVYKVEFEAAKKATEDATLTLKGVDSQITAGNVSTATGVYTFTTTKSIDGATVSGLAEAYTYNGESVEPTLTVKMGTDTLVEGADYVVSFKKNVTVGTGTAVLTGIGEYAGSTKTISFKINPAKVSFKKATVGAKKVTVKASKGKGAAGIQIAYRVKGTSKWTYKKTTKSSYTIKSLKKGKKYTISIRSYKKVGDTTYYSGWTTKTTKKVK